MNLAICTCNFHFFHKGIFDTNENALIILISSKNYPINQILLKIFITNRTSFFLFGYSFAKIIFSIDSNRFFYNKQIHAIPEINPAFKISTTRKRQVTDCSERNNIILAEIPCAARDESRTWKSTRLVSKNVRNFGNNPQWISSIRPVAVRRMWRMAAKLSDPGSMPLEPTWLDFVLHFLPLSLSLSVNSRFFLANKRLSLTREMIPRFEACGGRRADSTKGMNRHCEMYFERNAARKSRGDREKIGLSNLTWCRSREAWFVLRVMGS